MSLAFAMPKEPVPYIGDIALFSDFDGTLVEIASAPDAVVVSPETLSLVAGLRDKSGGSFALISGRQIADLDRLLAPLSFAASGCHGAEMRLRAGGEIHTMVEPIPLEIAHRLRDLAERIPGVLFEDKIYGICLHINDDAAADAYAILKKELTPFTGSAAYHLQMHFNKRGCETKRHNLDKGHAVRAFLTAPAFRDKLPVYLGDDVLDREAFAATRAAGGIAISVGKDNAFPEASFALPSVSAVHSWLRATLRESR